MFRGEEQDDSILDLCSTDSAAADRRHMRAPSNFADRGALPAYISIHK